MSNEEFVTKAMNLVMENQKLKSENEHLKSLLEDTVASIGEPVLTEKEKANEEQTRLYDNIYEEGRKKIYKEVVYSYMSNVEDYNGRVKNFREWVDSYMNTSDIPTWMSVDQFISTFLQELKKDYNEALDKYHEKKKAQEENKDE